MKLLIPISFALCAAFVAPVAVARSLVFAAELANLKAAQGEAIVALIAEAYAEASGDTVSRGKVPPAREDGSMPSYSEITAAQGGGEYLLVRATRLQSKIILSVTRHRQDGLELHGTRMTAASMDDLEPVATRIAEALYGKTTVSDSGTLDTVTAREAQAKNRTFVEKVMGVKAGHSWVFAKTDFRPMVLISFDGRLEASRYFLEFGAGVVTAPDTGNEDRSVGGLHTEIGASYYLTQTSVSPYIGGGAMPRILGGDVGGGANIALYGQGGVMFFRESSSRLFIDVRFAQNLTPWSTETYYLDESIEDGRTVYPQELGLSFGVGW